MAIEWATYWRGQCALTAWAGMPWHAFGHGLSGQCQALALLGRVPLVSLCCVDAPGQGQELKRGLEVEMPKVAGMATVCISLGFLFPLLSL